MEHENDQIERMLFREFARSNRIFPRVFPEESIPVSPRILLIACLAALAPSCSAWAQSDTPRPATSSEATAPARPYIIRVDSTMGVNVQAAAGVSVEEQLKLIEATRVALYQSAAAECENLKKVFKADCRLQNVRVNSNVQSRGNGGDMMQVNASSSHELTFRPY